MFSHYISINSTLELINSTAPAQQLDEFESSSELFYPARHNHSTVLITDNVTDENSWLINTFITLDNMSSSSPSSLPINTTSLQLAAPPSAVLITTACCLLLTFCIAGNLLVVLSFANEPTLQVITNYWIVSLSLTDIILATAVMPLQMMRELYDGKWTFGPLACDVFICMDVLCCTCSIYHLCLISLDRYFCVRFPFAYPQIRTKKATVTAIVCTWCVCIIISLPRLIGWKDAQPDIYACMMTNKVYMVFSSVLSFYFPLFLIICMYMAIYRTTHARTVKFNRYQLSQLQAPQTPRSDTTNMTTEPFLEETALKECPVTSIRASDESSTDLTSKPSPNRNEGRSVMTNVLTSRFVQSMSLQALLAHSLTFDSFYSKKNPDEETAANPSSLDKCLKADTKRFRPFFSLPSASDLRKRNQLNQAKLTRRRQKQEHRAAKVVIIVLAAFVLLWAPFFLVNLIGPLCHSCFISDDVWKLVTWLGYCNSAVNPVIYTFFNRTFRRAMIDICRKSKRIC